MNLISFVRKNIKDSQTQKFFIENEKIAKTNKIGIFLIKIKGIKNETFKQEKNLKSHPALSLFFSKYRAFKSSR